MPVAQMTTQTSANRGKYDATGRDYESRTYGAPHLEAYRELRNRRISEQIALHPRVSRGLAILEVACGTGLVLQSLAALGDEHQIVGLDISRVMLAQARDKFVRSNNPPFLLTASALALPFPDESLDVIVATRFIHLFDHDTKRAIVQEFRRVLRSEGMMIIEFYARPYHTLRYYFSSAAKGRSREAFFSHYPTRKEMREIMGASARAIPIRLAGQRLLVRALGSKTCNRLTSAMPLAGLNPLVDEYLVVQQRS